MAYVIKRKNKIMITEQRFAREGVNAFVTLKLSVPKELYESGEYLNDPKKLFDYIVENYD
ncbi:MAG: hypothetical protein LBB39_01285 [Mycoplasmataceae bacterium]|jgi:hypothetical protein|nr:hypothetical protein [Mycoplasmataceae bacterium]